MEVFEIRYDGERIWGATCRLLLSSGRYWMRKFNFRVLLLLSSGHMVCDIYQGALPAILPFLKQHLGLTYAMTGFILIVASFASSILQPVFGLLSDKKEKGFLLPAGVLAAGVGYSLLSLPSGFLPILALVT